MRARRSTAVLLAAVAAVGAGRLRAPSSGGDAARHRRRGHRVRAGPALGAPRRSPVSCSTAARYDVAPGPRPGRRAQLLGLLVRAVPGRGRRPGGTYQATKGAGVDVPRHQHPATSGTRPRRSRRAGSTYPSLFDPASRLALALDIPPNTIPATLVLDRAGPDRRGDPRPRSRRTSLQPIVERVAAEQPALTVPLMGETVPASWRQQRAAAAGHRRGGARRAGQLPVAVRAAAGAGLPLLRHRPGRRRPGRATRGGDRAPAAGRSPSRTRAAAVNGRVLAGTLLFVAGFTVVFIATAILFASIGRVLLRPRAHAGDRRRRADHRARAGATSG